MRTQGLQCVTIFLDVTFLCFFMNALWLITILELKVSQSYVVLFEKIFGVLAQQQAHLFCIVSLSATA